MGAFLNDQAVAGRGMKRERITRTSRGEKKKGKEERVSWFRRPEKSTIDRKGGCRGIKFSQGKKRLW